MHIYTKYKYQNIHISNHIEMSVTKTCMLVYDEVATEADLHVVISSCCVV